MKKAIALLLVVVMMMGLFTACKKDEEKTDSPNSTVTSSGENTSGSSIFDGGYAQENSSDNQASQNSSSDDNALQGSVGGSTTTDGNTPSGSSSTDNSQSSGGSSSDGNKTQVGGSSSNNNKPSVNTPSTPSGTTSGSDEDTSTMPAALKGLKGIEKYVNQPVDYSKAENWVSKPTVTKDVDVFFLYPTGYNASDESISDINDQGMLSLAKISQLGQASVFAQSCNIYMPKYRQFSIGALLKYGNDENMIYCASFDIYSALDYYFENENNGRPFILAGHSQGSVWTSVILQDYMKKHPEYLERMVAAYVIGFSVTKDFLKKNTHLKFATGATDTGVIISYNTEGPGNKNATSIVVQKGAVSINPINWKTDGTYAPASENILSLNNNTQEMSSPGFADAKVDTERGVVICTTAPKSLVSTGFGPESYHAHDYSFYYGNLMKNVADRIAAYKKSH